MILCGEFEEGLKAVVGHFVEVCRRRGLKVNDGVGWGGGSMRFAWTGWD